MREIPLTQGHVAIVDDEDYEELNQFKWYAHKARRIFYADRNVTRSDGSRKTTGMHRQIMGEPPNPLRPHVDHKNRDSLDNRRCNLRWTTLEENAHNRGLDKNNASGFKGVSWNKRDQNWRATIRVNNKKIHLGYFDTKEEAAKAYAAASEKYHGEFGRIQ